MQETLTLYFMWRFVGDDDLVWILFKSVEGTEGLHVACCGCTRVRDARGPLTKTSSHVPARHTASFFVGQDTLVMTLCCGSHPLGPTVDRHSLVNSGARYADRAPFGRPQAYFSRT